MSSYYSVREWLKKYEAGDFQEATWESVVDAGWYDWFCTEESCVKRIKHVYKLLKGITNATVLDFKISFKNVCPLEGNLYDYIYLENEEENIWLCIEHRDKKWAIYEEYDDSYSMSIPRKFKTKRELFFFLNNFEITTYKKNLKEAHTNRSKKLDELYDCYYKFNFNKILDELKSTKDFEDYNEKWRNLQSEFDKDCSNIPL